jgi:hypothetical protein
MTAKIIKIVGGKNDAGVLTLCEIEVYSLDPPG